MTIKKGYIIIALILFYLHVAWILRDQILYVFTGEGWGYWLRRIGF